MRMTFLAGSIVSAITSLVLLSASADPPVQPPAPARERDAAAAEDGPQQYVFRIGLYRLNQPGEMDAAGIRHFPERHPPMVDPALGVPHHFGALQCEQCHREIWPSGAGAGLTTTAADRIIGEALTASVVEVIAEPVLSTIQGRPALLRLQGGEAEYFVREANGQFRLEKIQDESGIEVRLRVSDARNENDTQTVMVDPFEIRITTLDHRKPVGGVELPVGKPVFRTFEWDATLTCHPGQMNAFTVDSPRQGRILVVVRLDVPENEGETTSKEVTAPDAADVAARAAN